MRAVGPAVHRLARLPRQRSRRLRAFAMSAAAPVFFLDEFASRQWSDPNYSGTRLSCDQADLVARAEAAVASGAALVDGYAPFCKHLFLPNFCGAQPGAVEITAANRSLLRSGYGARTPSELPVLQRWFSAADVGPLMPAKYLDLILYSREQLVKERAATGRSDAPPLPDAPWGIISVKAQDADFELPMQPITVMRNASIGEGGSGVPIDRVAYMKSVAYWETHAPVVAGERPSGD